MSTNDRLNELKQQTDAYSIRLRTIEQHIGQLEEKTRETLSLEQLLIVYGDVMAWQAVHEQVDKDMSDDHLPVGIGLIGYLIDSMTGATLCGAFPPTYSERILDAIRKIWRKRTAQREMKKLQAIQKQLEELLSTDKVLSERFCILLRKIEKEIGQRLKENDRIVELEQKEIERLKKKFQEEMEAELLRAKRNAAY